jgi:anti-sigma regulatory factor (Ser/Thr protein kinase)
MIKVRQNDIAVPNTTASLEEVRRFVSEFLGDTPFTEKERRRLVLAIDEAVTSTILFSEASGRRGTTRVSLDVDEVRLRVRIEDRGRDPDYDAGDPAEEVFEEHIRQARKYEVGVFLIRQIMDEINYIFRKGFQNELELVRFLYPKALNAS